jgi:hypothetical protein
VKEGQGRHWFGLRGKDSNGIWKPTWPTQDLAKSARAGIDPKQLFAPTFDGLRTNFIVAVCYSANKMNQIPMKEAAE